MLTLLHNNVFVDVEYEKMCNLISSEIHPQCNIMYSLHVISCSGAWCVCLCTFPLQQAGGDLHICIWKGYVFLKGLVYRFVFFNYSHYSIIYTNRVIESEEQ